ncbi:MAG: nucleotide exchange factor GrpE [Bacteroidia bacterium]|nr:nucleotide exchange factor GrpE [Bacteroidia bacterium]
MNQNTDPEIPEDTIYNPDTDNNFDNEEPETSENTETGEIAKLKAEVKEVGDKYLRLYAEFDNFRRRTAQEKLEITKTASKDIILSLLSVLDDFERAKKAADSSDDIVSIREGIDLIHTKLYSLLEGKGLKPIKAVGEKFDVDLHEAITNIPAPNENMIGKVIDEVERGYTLNDKVIRFTKVVVGE